MVSLPGPFFTDRKKRSASLYGAATIEDVSTSQKWLIGFSGTAGMFAS